MDFKNGCYIIFYRLSIVGEYMVFIKVVGNLIKGSLFKLIVKIGSKLKSKIGFWVFK